MRLFFTFFTFFFSYLLSAQITDPTPYCPNDYQTAANAAQPHLSEVLLGDINQASLQEGYLFYNTSLTALETGTDYALQFTIVGPTAQAVAAWIDYNSDEIFDENEKIGELVDVGNLEGVQQFDFTIPTDAVINQTRLRLRVVEHDVVFIDSASTTVEPCQVQVAMDGDGNPVIEDYDIGETEDYVVWIQDPALGEDTLVTVSSENDINLIDVNAGTLQMFAQTNPFTEPVTWSVTNGTGLASIDANGLLTAIADGEVSVVATATLGGVETEGTMTIQISNQTPVFELEPAGLTEAFVCQGTVSQFEINVDVNESFTGSVDFSVSGAPAGLFINILPNSITSDAVVVLELNNVSASTTTATLECIATANGYDYQDTLYFDLSTFNSLPFIPLMISPIDDVINQPLFTTLDWHNTLRAATYDIEIATDEDFTTVVHAASELLDSEYQAIFLASYATDYYWRVRAVNPCGVSGWSVVRHYSTVPFLATEGCTDPEALNYNAAATLEDGSCNYTIEGCTDPDALNYNTEAVVDDGSCFSQYIHMNIDEVEDTTFNFSFNHVIGAIAYVNWNFGDGSPIEHGETQSHHYGENGIYPIEAQVYSIPLEVLFYVRDTIVVEAWGCTDPYSINFDIPAVYDDGSCEAFVFGCTNPLSPNYNPLANTDDGTCIAVVEGCTDPAAFNYNPSANYDDGSCIDVVLGCTDEEALNYNSAANTDDGSCIAQVLGCMDVDAYNYNPDANVDDGSCEDVVLGCIDDEALNFDPAANTDDGSCEFDAPNDEAWDVFPTSENHTILVLSTLDVSEINPPLEVGDYLGVFYSEGFDEWCGGKMAWTGSNAILTAYGSEDFVDNGFQVGEPLRWKIWRQADNSTTPLEAEYDLTQTHAGQYADDGISAVTKLAIGTSQMINLDAGWNFISTNVNPVFPAMDSVFSTVSDDLFLAKDETGAVYWPSVGVNSIGNHSIGEAYKVNMNADAVLEVKGAVLSPENHPITLPSGWSYLGYVRQVSADISAVLTSVSSAMFLIKNLDGDVYWPGFGINNIGNMEVGHGYQINMQSDEILTFPSNSVVLPVLKQSKAQPTEHYTSIKQTSEHMHLALPLELLETELAYGDELAVYIGETLVGAAKFANQNLVLTIYGQTDLEEQILRFELWQEETEKPLVLHLETTEKQVLNYQKDAAYRVSKLVKLPISDVLSPELFSATTTQLMYLGSPHAASEPLAYRVIDNTGRQVFESTLDLKAGSIDLPTLPTGHYIIQLISSTQAVSVKWLKQ